MTGFMRVPGMRLASHLAFVAVVWFVLTTISNNVDPLMNLNMALAGLYATALFGMVVLVGLSGQVSLGNGALMAIGAYSFALTSLHWATVPIIGVPMNTWWAMLFAAIGGILCGLVIGVIGARLKGPYLAGLTLGIAVGIPAIANRFPDFFGGETGIILTVPYPDGGYQSDTGLDSVVPAGADTLPTDFPTSQDAFPGASFAPGDMLTPADVPPAGASPLASSDMLTPDNFPSTGASPLASSDMLTPDNFSSAAPVDSIAANPPTDTASASGLDSFVIEHWQAGLSILVACIALFLVLNLVRGRQGRVWRAVRDDPIAAAVSGISPAKAKIGAFVISSLMASLAGGVFAQVLTYVGPGAFGLGLSLSLLVGIVLGGRSYLLGAVIGAVLLVWLPIFIGSASGDRGWSDQVTNNMPNLIYGLLVVLVVLIAPGGIVGTVRSAIDKVRGKVVVGD